MGDEGPPRLVVIVFSKDRPCQLLSCLASMALHVTDAVLEIYVLYRTTSQAFADSYRVVKSLFDAEGSSLESRKSHLIMHWLEETDDRPLGDLLEEVASTRAHDTDAVLFTVDDALWFRRCNVGAAVRLLQSQEDVYTVHVKLCPRNEFAHPNDKFMRVPRLHSYVDEAAAVRREIAGVDGVAGSSRPGEVGLGEVGLESEFFIYDRSQGEYDWNYPWELSASVYRWPDVCEMLGAIRERFGAEGVNHPNRLEGFGVRIFKQEGVSSVRRKKCACMRRPVVAVVTINRVQTLFDNPVYGPNAAAADELSPEALDQLLRAELLRGACSLAGGAEASAADSMQALTALPAAWLQGYWSETDSKLATGALTLSAGRPPSPLIACEPYRATYADSVHLPLLAALPQQVSHPLPVVSWLMPVRNGKAAWLAEALQSIRAQQAFGPGSWELVVVDDGSDDACTRDELARWVGIPEVNVIRSEENVGIGAALNLGLRHCRGAFVARLDADDLAHEERLSKQLAFFDAHPSISILGGGFCTFRDSAELASQMGLAGCRYYRMPCHPVLVQWRMLFSCSLAHPTVTFRLSDLPDGEGIYPEQEEAEDHCCWLNFSSRLHMANIADVVGYLRRHGDGRTAVAADAIRRSSYGAVRRFLGLHCMAEADARELTDSDVALLWGVSSAESPEQAQRVSAALDGMESYFLRLLSVTSSSADGTVSEEDSFAQHFVEQRRAALQEYIQSSCSKLRGFVAVQSLAAGDVDSGAEMVKMLLKSGGDGGLKSLAALISAGYAS